MGVQSTNHAPHLKGRSAARLVAAWNGLNRVTDIVWEWVDAIYTRYENRRGVRQMLELEDHVLRDIGVTRYDIVRASNQPLSSLFGGETPGEELERITRQSRYWKHASR